MQGAEGITARAPALAGTLVVDLGRGPAARFAARLFADCGAQVVAVDPGGHTAEDWWLSLSKEVLPAQASPGLLAELLAAADVVIDDESAGRRSHGHFQRLNELNPRAVHLTVTPFGLEGPYAAMQGDAILAEALAGMTWERGGERGKPPLPLQSNLLEHAVGANAFACGMVALACARRTGLGQRVEVSMLETIVIMNEALAAMYPWNGASPSRLWDPYSYLPGIMRAKDAWVRAMLTTAAEWEVAEQVLFGRAITADPRFASQQDRIANADALRAELAGWFAEQDARTLFLRGQELRLQFTWFPPIGQLASEPHLMARGTFTEVDGRVVPASAVGGRSDLVVAPRPARPFTGIRAAPVRSRPAETTGGMALAGLKVVDLTHYWAGPTVTRILADFGADVLHFESSARPDGMRMVLQADNLSHDRPWERGWSAFVNRNKRSVALDLSRPEGRELLLEFVRDADVVVENFTPRVLQNWEISYDRLRAINPRVVFASLSGFGADGPWANFVAMGVALESLSGQAGLARYPGAEAPHVVDSTISDPVSGFWGAGLVLAAVERARQTGEGCRIDFSELDACACLIGDEYAVHGPRPAPISLRYEPLACQGDDQWLVVDTSTLDRERLAGAGVATLPSEQPLEALRRALSSQSKHEAMGGLQRAGIAAAAIQSAGEVYDDPQLRARAFFVPMDHPVFGSYPLNAPNGRFERTPGLVRTRAPLLGEHTVAVLEEHGLNGQQVAALEAAGIVDRAPVPGVRVEPVRLGAWIETGAMSAPVAGVRSALVQQLRAEQDAPGAPPQGGDGANAGLG